MQARRKIDIERSGALRSVVNQIAENLHAGWRMSLHRRSDRGAVAIVVAPDQQRPWPRAEAERGKSRRARDSRGDEKQKGEIAQFQGPVSQERREIETVAGEA